VSNMTGFVRRYSYARHRNAFKIMHMMHVRRKTDEKTSCLIQEDRRKHASSYGLTWITVRNITTCQECRHHQLCRCCCTAVNSDIQRQGRNGVPPGNQKVLLSKRQHACSSTLHVTMITGATLQTDILGVSPFRMCQQMGMAVPI